MSTTQLEIRNVIISNSGWDGITADWVATFTNKTLDDYTNFIHADGIHLRVKATEDISYGDCLSFVGFNNGEQAIEVKKRNNLTEPIIGISHDDMSIGGFWMAVSNGLFKKVNTSAFSQGTILYGNASWGFTDTPTINDNNYNQAIAYVVRSSTNNGEIMLNIGNGHEKANQIGYGSGSVKDRLDALGTMANQDTTSYDTSGAVDTKISTAISSLVDTAPWTLDTLNELANALGDDPNFSTTILTALGDKVDKVVGKWLSQEDYTTAEKNKLSWISEWAEVNVNADWNSTGGDSQILNKPTLGTASSLDVTPTGNASSTQVVKGDDTRLSDARTPTAHTHTASDITDLIETIEDTIGSKLIGWTNVSISYNNTTGETTISSWWVSLIPELISDPVSPQVGEQWILNYEVNVGSTQLNNPLSYQLWWLMIAPTTLIRQALKLKTSIGTYIISNLT